MMTKSIRIIQLFWTSMRDRPITLIYPFLMNPQDTRLFRLKYVKETRIWLMLKVGWLSWVKDLFNLPAPEGVRPLAISPMMHRLIQATTPMLHHRLVTAATPVMHCLIRATVTLLHHYLATAATPIHLLAITPVIHRLVWATMTLLHHHLSTAANPVHPLAIAPVVLAPNHQPR